MLGQAPLADVALTCPDARPEEWRRQMLVQVYRGVVSGLSRIDILIRTSQSGTEIGQERASEDTVNDQRVHQLVGGGLELDCVPKVSARQLEAGELLTTEEAESLD